MASRCPSDAGQGAVGTPLSGPSKTIAREGNSTRPVVRLGEIVNQINLHQPAVKSQVNPTQSRGQALLEALANDTPTEAALLALWRAARSWVASGAAVPLERYAQLPATPGALSNAARNLWIRRAAELLAPGLPAFTQAQRLESELAAFISRGPWAFWREAPAPPDTASELRRSFFYVAKFNNGDSLSQRHLARIIANK